MNQDEIIYSRNVFNRVGLFVLYYWITVSGLIILPLCIAGTGYFIWKIIQSFASPVNRPAYANFDYWLAVFIGAIICTMMIRMILRGFKSFIKPLSKIEGIVMDKEERHFEHKKHYYILLRTNDRIRINEKCYTRIQRGNKVVISWSNKIDQPMKITRVNT